MHCVSAHVSPCRTQMLTYFSINVGQVDPLEESLRKRSRPLRLPPGSGQVSMDNCPLRKKKGSQVHLRAVNDLNLSETPRSVATPPRSQTLVLHPTLPNPFPRLMKMTLRPLKSPVLTNYLWKLRVRWVIPRSQASLTDRLRTRPPHQTRRSQI